jgi:Response regulator containing a CheY-like receiver domain and an HTH DNA-binding domain
MTDIEKQIVLLKADGLTVKAIAGKLRLNETAVSKRIQRLVKKHGCKSFINFYKLVLDKNLLS